MYVNFVFNAIFFGYAIGSGPVIAFHYGAEDHGELKSLLHKSLVLTAAAGAAMTASGAALAYPLSAVFVGYDPQLMAMTSRGMLLYAFSFLFAGFNVFSSAFFTALNNGAVSASISSMGFGILQAVVDAVQKACHAHQAYSKFLCQLFHRSRDYFVRRF